LQGDASTAQQIVAQLDSNPLTTFTTLLTTEEKKQSDAKGTTAVVVNQCTK
jgi:uncharacterized glyoxalase superfamily metalloenzyme YdcJ